MLILSGGELRLTNVLNCHNKATNQDDFLFQYAKSLLSLNSPYLAFSAMSKVHD